MAVLGALGDLVLALSADTARFQSDLGKADRVAKKFVREVEDQFKSLRHTIASVAGSIGVGALVKSFFDAGSTMQRFRIAFEAAAGSAAEGADNLGFIHELSQSLGISFVETATAFQKFSAAVEGSALEGEAARKIFTSFAGAARVLGSNAQDTGLIFLALEQMVSKGKVSTEELRRQLGERLPGAFRLAAEALGVTTSELDKMLREGSITAEDLLPKLAQRVEDVYGAAIPEASRLAIAELDRLKNKWLEVRAAIAEDSGFMSTVSDVLRISAENMGAMVGAANAVKIAMQTVVVLGANVSFVLKGIGRDMGGIAAQLVALAKLDFAGFSAIGAELRADAVEARAELDAFEKRILGLGEAAEDVAPKIEKGINQPVRKATVSAKEAKEAFKEYLKAFEFQEEVQREANDATNEYFRKQGEMNAKAAEDRETMWQQVFEEIDRDQERAIEEGRILLEHMSDTGRDVGSILKSSFDLASVAAGEFGDIVQNVTNRLAEMIFQRSVLEPAADAISGAIGNIDFGSIFKVPSFDVGTDFVPRTGLAMVHRGERIIPAEQNRPGAMGGVNIVQNINIDSRTDRASIALMLERNKAETVATVRALQNRSGDARL